MSFSVDCTYCAPPNSIMAFQPHADQDQAAFDAAWKRAAPGYANIECAVCGAQYSLQDDPGGSVQQHNVSKPQVDSLSVTGGARTGGEALYINGSALELGVLVVKFDGKLTSEVTNRTATSVRVVTPQGAYRLHVIEELTKLTLSGVSGAFAINEEVQVEGQTIGNVRHLVGALCYIARTNSLDLIGKTVTGVPSGATGTIDAASLPLLIEGEEVVGQTSGAKGVLRARPDFVVDNPTRAFTANELVVGSASGGYVLLDSTPYHGTVDVEVSNENGQRLAGGTLLNGFTYL